MIIKRRRDGTVAHGQLRNRRCRALVGFDPTVFAEVRRRATSTGLSVSQVAQDLVAFALSQQEAPHG